MLEKINNILKKILGSLDTTKNGFSARKLAAFTIITMVVTLHVKWFNSDRWEYVGEILAMDYSFIALCLGLATYQAITESKNKADDTGAVSKEVG